MYWPGIVVPAAILAVDIKLNHAKDEISSKLDGTKNQVTFTNLCNSIA